MEIKSSLKKLAKEFKRNNYTLFIVGGYVRDSIMNLPSKDIDIASNMPYEKVIEICSKLKMKAIPVNKKLGTLQIKVDNDTFEYTQFRAESYGESGIHKPDKIEFVNDIEIDAIRRDITINSIYYDIVKDEIVDLVDGVRDIENKTIRTTNLPNITLNDDGLRILRIIRFASLLNFKIAPETFKAMKLHKENLCNISKERILAEIQMLCIADLNHKIPNTIFLKLLAKLRLYEIIFNSTLSRMKKIKKIDIENFYKTNKDSRLIAFYLMIIKNYTRAYLGGNQLSFVINMILGHDGIKESKNNINTTEKIYRIYQNLTYGVDIINATINYLTLSDAERNIIDCFINKNTKSVLSANMSYIKSKNLPLNIHELDITSEDLINNGIERIYISKILSTLYNQVIECKVYNKKQDLINLALQINDTFKKIGEEIK